MGRWWSQDFLCEACGARFDLVVQYDDREKPTPCVECGEEGAVPVIGAPAVMGTALPDGSNRGVAWDREKEIAKLKLERKKTRPDRRGDVDRAIGKLKREQLGK